MGEFLTLQGKQIPFTRTSIPVLDCELDPANPRIQYLVGQRVGPLSQKQLDQLIWEKDTVKALSQSIKQNGGVYEHLVVQRVGGKYRVREGNCRTVACRHLLTQFPNDTRFATMPAMIFDVELTDEDLAIMLADMHVASKIRWDAYEQARQVHTLHHKYAKTYDWLSNHLRLSKSKIQELLLAYRATTEFLTDHPEPENVRKFSLFYEVMKRKALRLMYEGDPTFKSRFHKWLADGRIFDSKQVRDLQSVLANPEAEKALDTKGFDEAARVLVSNDPSLASDLFWAIKNATEQLKAAPANEIHELKSNVQKILMLRNLSRAVDDLATLAGVEL